MNLKKQCLAPKHFQRFPSEAPMELTFILLLFLWDNVEPTLAKKRCSQLPTYERAFVSAGYIKAEYQQGDVIFFSCDPGYTSGLNTTYVCTEYGWIVTTFGQCIEVDPTFPVRVACAPPLPLKNGFLLLNSTLVYEDGQQARYQCDPLYTMTGGGSKTCNNGQWTGDPQCQAHCSAPDIHNGFVEYDRVTFPHNSVLHYGCNASFKPVENTVTCQNGNWSSLPQCVGQEEANPAPVPPVSTGASPVNPGSGNNYQPMISPTSQCGPVPEVKNGVAYYESDTSLRYECISLVWYKLKGNRIVKCINGQWSPAPTCAENFCKLDTSGHHHLENINEFMRSGTQRKVDCPNDRFKTARAVCINSELFLSDCCPWITHYKDNCGYVKVTTSQ